MAWELYKGKIVELYLIQPRYRWSGTCIDVTDGFIIIRNDRDDRILSFRLTDIETIREVRS